MALNNYQWDMFWEGLNNRWPLWKPADIVATDWREALGKYDVFVLDKAVKKCVIEHRRYNTPDLSLIYKLTAQITAKKISQERSDRPVKIEDIAWLCYDLDEHGKGPIGKLYHSSCIIDQVAGLELTNSQSRRYEETHGGRWLFISGLQNIRRKRHESLHNAKLCQSYCPLCQEADNPEKTKAINEASAHCDLPALTKLLFESKPVLSPKAATKAELLNQKKNLATKQVEPDDFDPNRLLEDDKIPF